MHSFDRIAPIYDFLASVFFLKQWSEAQYLPVKYLNGKKNLLIVGGGTGKLLEQCNPYQEIDYVELSQRMILIARKRNCPGIVNFICEDYLSWDSQKKYDAILFPFFLDCFNEKSLRKVILAAKEQLAANGAIHVLDFQSTLGNKNLLIRFMYLFFRLVTNLEGDKLLDFRKYLAEANFRETCQEESLYGWVKYGVYETLA